MGVSITAVQRSQDKTNNDIFALLFEKDEITWQDIIYDLIKTEQMDPWDVDVSLLAERFIELLKEMKKMDFRLSGKIILAAAFFLKIKSDKLLHEDMDVLNNLINPIDNSDELLGMLDSMPDELRVPMEKPILTFRTPQPRKRKVSVYDLVHALEKALETDNRRTFKRNISTTYAPIKMPKKDRDVTLIINDVYKKIQMKMDKLKVVTFSELIESDSKEDKLYIFVPLVYLDTQRKIDLEQVEHFGEINIHMVDKKKINVKSS
ncbi:MAG: ScpA family protein [Candidatus Woesearchaeota archaeon]|jgi:segregation and condensation protein A